MLTKINIEDLRKFIDEKENESDSITLSDLRYKLSQFEDLETIKSLTAMADNMSLDSKFKDFVFANIQKFGGEVIELWKAYQKQNPLFNRKKA